MTNGNNRPPGYGGETNEGDWSPGVQRPQDEILETKTMTTSRKTFTLTRRRNKGGEFIRVDEERGRYRNTIIVAAEDVPAFLENFLAIRPLKPGVGG